MIWTEKAWVKIVLKEGMETKGRAHVMTAKSHSNDDCKVTPYSKEIFVLSAAISWINIPLHVHCFPDCDASSKETCHEEACSCHENSSHEKASRKASGSNSPMPPMPDELQQLQAGLDRPAQNPEILEEAFHALGEPGTPEMDPLGLAEMEALLDRALQYHTCCQTCS